MRLHEMYFANLTKKPPGLFLALTIHAIGGAFPQPNNVFETTALSGRVTRRPTALRV